MKFKGTPIVPQDTYSTWSGTYWRKEEHIAPILLRVVKSICYKAMETTYEQRAMERTSRI